MPQESLYPTLNSWWAKSFLRAVLPAAITYKQKCDKLSVVGSPWGSHKTTGDKLRRPVACPIIVSAWLLVWRTPLSKLWETCTRRMRTLHGWLGGAINFYEWWTPNVFITKPIPLASWGEARIKYEGGRSADDAMILRVPFCAPPIDFVTTIPCWQWMDDKHARVSSLGLSIRARCLQSILHIEPLALGFSPPPLWTILKSGAHPFLETFS